MENPKITLVTDTTFQEQLKSKSILEATDPNLIKEMIKIQRMADEMQQGIFAKENVKYYN